MVVKIISFGLEQRPLFYRNAEFVECVDLTPENPKNAFATIFEYAKRYIFTLDS